MSRYLSLAVIAILMAVASPAVASDVFPLSGSIQTDRQAYYRLESVVAFFEACNLSDETVTVYSPWGCPTSAYRVHVVNESDEIVAFWSWGYDCPAVLGSYLFPSGACWADHFDASDFGRWILVEPEVPPGRYRLRMTWFDQAWDLDDVTWYSEYFRVWRTVHRSRPGNTVVQ